jgi:hypothetical protein
LGRRVGKVEQVLADTIASYQTQVKVAEVRDGDSTSYELTCEALCAAVFGTRDPTRAQQVSVLRAMRKLVKPTRVRLLPAPEHASVHDMKRVVEVWRQLKPGWYSRIGAGRNVYYWWKPKVTRKQESQNRSVLRPQSALIGRNAGAHLSAAGGVP